MTFERINPSDRLPPQNLDAERSVLGSMLRDNGCIAEVSLLLSAGSFYLDAHQKIFAAILDLHGPGGQPVDLVILAGELIRRDQLDDIGRAAYLAELWDAAPTAANAAYYAKMVRDKAIGRNLIHVATEVLRDAYAQNQPAAELLEGAEQKILALGDLGSEGATSSVGETMREVLKRIDDRSRRCHHSGVPTGFEKLDDLTTGLQSSECIVLAARPGVGKTAMAVRLAAHAAAAHQVPVFFASLEMSRLELTERLICSEAQVSSCRMRRGYLTPEDLDRVAATANSLHGVPIFIDDAPLQSMQRIAANARRLKRKKNIGLVVVDYLQLVQPEDRREPRHEQVGGISRRLKILARDLAVPVVALAQLNRESENRPGQRPRLSDLRESGGIEADADTVVLMHRPADQWGNLEQTIELIVAKQRNGPVGEVSVRFHPDELRFESPGLGGNPFAN